MSPRFLVSIVVLVALISIASSSVSVLAQTRSSSLAPAKAWTPTKTPGGDPDLEGIWTSTTNTPFERPPQFGNRQFLTDEEYAETQKQLERQLEADSQTTVSSNARIGTGPPGHWTERAS